MTTYLDLPWGRSRPVGTGLWALLWLALACTPRGAWTATGAPAPADPQAVLAIAGRTPEGLFRFVRDETAPDLNRHPLKGPREVLATGRGNSVERARLLGELLTLAGHPVRYQEGRLGDDSAARLIEAAVPPAQGRTWPPGVPRARPAEDPTVRAAVSRHVWTQVLQGGRWVDLDPSLPEARPGERYAEEGAPFYRFGPDRVARVELTLEVERVSEPGAFSELAWWDGPLETIAGRAVGLRVFPVVRRAARGERDLDPARRLVAPLAGADEPVAPGATQTSWRAEIAIDAEVVASGEAAPGEARDGAADPLRSLRLRVRTILPGGEELEDERVIFRADPGQPTPVLYQRQALLIATGRVARQQVEEVLAARPAAERNALRERIERLRRDLKDEPKPLAPLLDEALDLDRRLGPGAGHLLTLAFAALSDELADDLARRLGVHAYYDEPRVLIASFAAAADGRVETSVDLRRDRQRAVPRPGSPAAMTRTYQHGRGVIESLLEGRVVSLATGVPALTTASLMRAARAAGTPLRLYSAREQAALAALPLPEPVREQIEATLARGQVVVLPQRPVRVAGRDRWGWWEVSPASLETVGVLDGGLHQATVERTLIETEGVLSDEMAAVIGAITGATDTQWVVSALVLKHGALTEEVLQEAKGYLKHVAEYLCQEQTLEAKAEASREIFSASFAIEGCYEYEVSLEARVEAGGSLTLMDKGWCQAFQRGFSCAAMTILNAYLSQH